MRAGCSRWGRWPASATTSKRASGKDAAYSALRAIGRRPGASARELAAATFQTEQAFGTLAGRLVAQGLLDRRPGRGRRIEHHLTAEGERVLKAGHEVADAVLAECFEGLADAERKTLLGLLRKVEGA